MRKVSRAQLLAGVQAGIALPPRTLLGRTSPNTGAPEPIQVGANLTFAAGILAAPAPFSTSLLPPGRPPSSTDLVPVLQSGRDAAVAYGPFLAGLGTFGSVDLSRHIVRAGHVLLCYANRWTKVWGNCTRLDLCRPTSWRLWL